MGKVRVHMMISLDGYIAGPNQTLEKPFGDGTEGLESWVFATNYFRTMLGMEGGDTGVNDEVVRETAQNLGATIMGRKMFGGWWQGPWNNAEPWTGWWGPNPPYHTSTFVLTHYPREPLVMEGGTTFYFVTEGIDAALRMAREAAGDRDIRIGGGGSVAGQFLGAGHVDELELHVAPVIIGAGQRLLDLMGGARPKLEPIRTIAGPGVTHVKYRVVR